MTTRSGWLKTLASRVTRRRALGIHVAGQTVSVVAVVLTPLGIRHQGSLQAPLDVECPWKTMKEVFEKAKREFGKINEIATNIGLSDVLLVTRPVAKDGLGEDYTQPEVLATILPPVLSPKSVVVEGVAARSRGDRLFLVAVCKRTVVFATMLIFGDAKVPVNRYEPVHWAALRQSFHVAAPGPTGDIRARLLLGPHLALGYLLDGTTPLLCLTAHPDEETLQDDLLRLVRALESHARMALDVTLTQGSVQGGDPDAAVGLSLRCGLAFEHLPGPALGSESLAFGLALGGVDWGLPAPNMAAKLMAQPSLWTYVNVEETVLLLALICIMIGVLLVPTRDVRNRSTSLAALNAQTAWAVKHTNAALQKKQDELDKLNQENSRFLGDPVTWAEVLVRLPRLLARDTRLTAITVRNAGWSASGQAFRSLQLSVVGEDERQFAEAIRRDSYLGGVFPSVKLDGISRGPDDQERSYVVTAIGSGPITPPAEPGRTSTPSPAKDPGKKRR